MPLSAKSIDFLFENRVMDSKPWFLEHKADYEALVLDPLRELVTALAPTMHAIDPLLICEPKIGRSISRIYRDTRFSRDKSIFRDVMWCVFCRAKTQGREMPGFYFEFSPKGLRYGCGYYEAGANVMEVLRQMILQDEAPYLDALRAFKKQSVFYLENTKLKRSRYPEQSEEKRQWLDQRSLCFLADSEDFDLLYSDALAEKLAQDFKLLEPMYRFMLAAESRAIRPQAVQSEPS